MSPSLERHVVYSALTEPVLVMGLPRSVLGPELTMVGIGCYGLGWSLWTLLLVAVFALGVHPQLVRRVGDDAEVVEVFLRSLRLHDAYQAQPRAGSPRIAFLGSLPEV